MKRVDHGMVSYFILGGKRADLHPHTLYPDTRLDIPGVCRAVRIRRSPPPVRRVLLSIGPQLMSAGVVVRVVFCPNRIQQAVNFMFGFGA